jgi:two-component system, cell cycle sensor histidine kinase and response regulator CckA
MAVSDPGLAFLDHIREGLQIIGRAWRYHYVNRAAAEHGRRAREELVGRTMMECYPGIDATDMFAMLQRCMESSSVERVENEFTFPDGSRARFELSVEPVPEGVLILSVDITERKTLEAQLHQAQRLESIGRLAGGIAHDFNNLLTVIISFAEFARASQPEGSGDDDDDDMDQIITAAHRAAGLVRQLLAFSRRQVVDPRVLSVNDHVTELEKMLARVLGEDIELSNKLDPELWPVRIDPGALEQVLMNLAVNARDAMPEGGKLTLETNNVALDESYQAARGGVVEPGEYVVLAVSDSGAGMDLETQAHIFEPFYSTKGERGTGLGLSTCYGIVKQAGGHIWLYSEPGAGTTFKIYLPRVQEAVETRSRVADQAPASGDETVLVVEDDPLVRALAVRSLREYQYQVLEAPGCEEALRLLESADQRIDLLLTDVVMPGMSGKALAERARELGPGMRVLFMSGYAEEAIAQNRLLDRGVDLIQKPFTPAALARKVRVVLDA